VLDHSPKAADAGRFLQAFEKQQAAGRARGLAVAGGITTDGSALYPGPAALLFSGVPHQACSFHVVKELTRSVLHALAKARKELKPALPALPALPRGRPKRARRKQAGPARVLRERQRINELFEHRYLFVTHRLSPSDRRTLRRVTRGLPQLRVRVRVPRAGDHGRGPRPVRPPPRPDGHGHGPGQAGPITRRVKRFKAAGKALRKLYSPNVEKALTFPDDKPLPPTSDAVERGNRRRRKVRKAVCRGARSGASSGAWRWTCCARCTPPAGPVQTRCCTAPARPADSAPKARKSL